MNLGGLSFLKSQNTSIQPGSVKETVRQTVSEGAPQNDSGLELLKGMVAGDTFQGEVLSVKGNQVLLQLQGNLKVMANITGDFQAIVGRNMTFMLEDNSGSTISIKPLTVPNQEFVMADKALELAGLPVNTRNLAMVSELVRQNMPINKNSLMEMTRIINKYPDVDIKTLATMNRLDIPITESNIAQFKAYQSYENLIFNDVKGLTDGLLEGMAGQSPKQAANTLDILTGTLFEFSDSQIPKEALEALTAKIDEALPKEIAQALKESVDGENASLKDFLNNLKEQLKLMDDKDGAKSFLGSNEMKELIKEAVSQSLSYKLEDGFSRDSVKEFFAKGQEILKNLEEAISKNPDMQKVSQHTENIRQNMDFMNDINRNMAYFQMPIKFSQGQGNGELYVFADKRKIAAKSDNLSALLHLDMEHLGPVDVMVRLNGKNVSTNFSLESEEMLDFVYSRIDILNERLENLGYSTKIEMKVKDFDKPQNLINDFLDKDTRPIEINQYIFDMKA